MKIDMDEWENSSVCKKHSGIKAKIEILERNVSELWRKWDSMQKMLIGIFVTLSLNLIVGIILLLLRAYAK